MQIHAPQREKNHFSEALVSGKLHLMRPLDAPISISKVFKEENKL